MTVDAFVELTRGCEQILPEATLKERLASGSPLTIKAGFDPTASDLHLGHAVLLRKLRQFQDVGHHVIFLIGGFTARLGDPTGKDATRPPLSAEAVKQHAQTYVDQVTRVLDPARLDIRNNDDWFSSMTASDLMALAGSSTVARMLEREDFSQRYREGHAIAIHEFLYPLLQGYDSVHLKADVELGGTDQIFNLLMGRELQRQAHQPQQVVMTLPLLVGLDGVKKMSKSLGNTIGLTDTPDEMFGKVMSISDALMWSYYELLSEKTADELKALQVEVASGRNPRDIKMMLAHELVTCFHSPEMADQAQHAFIERFSRRIVPEDLELLVVKVPETGLPLAQVLKHIGFVTSTSDALRLIRQGAVRIDEDKCLENRACMPQSEACVLQAGKRRIARVCFELEG